ncbi:MAG: iron-containing alcohol dehydrogenase [Spirochaetia bacterium]
MMPFTFSRFPELHFGAGCLSDLPDILTRRKIGKVLVVSGGFFTSTGAYGRLTGGLESSGIRAVYRTVTGEPSPETVDNLVRVYRDQKCVGIISIGGGSVIDAGKAAAAGTAMDKPVKTYLEGVGSEQPPGDACFFAAVPTTSGTGSEATKNAVLSTVGPDGFKKSLRHEDYIPGAAFLDPELTASCPPGVTAASGLDALTQLIEAYVSVKSNRLTDMLSRDGITAAGKSLERAVREGSSIDARAGMAYAAFISGVCLANAGLGVVHGIASPAGALRPVPHGTVCGLLLPGSIEMTCREAGNCHPAVKKYSEASVLFTGLDSGSDLENCELLVSKIREIIRLGGLSSLRDYGFSNRDAELIAEKSSLKNHPVHLDTGLITELIKEAL